MLQGLPGKYFTSIFGRHYRNESFGPALYELCKDCTDLPATSLIVAEKFNKEDYQVLRDIKKLDCSLMIRADNFVGYSYKSKLVMIKLARELPG